VPFSCDDAGEWLLTWTGSALRASTLHPLLESFSDLDERERALDIGPNNPVLISPDGSCDVRLCEFFASPHFASLRMSTRQSYAADLRMWLEYLWSRGLTWSQASVREVNTYWLWRSRGDLNKNSVSGSKANRELAAISLLYRWAAHPTRGHVGFNPVERESLRPSRSGYQSAHPVRSRNVVAERVKWVTPRTYRLWRKVGIEGYTLDDLRNPSFKGRNALRNKAMMDMLFSSGLRISEGSSLLTLELPAQDRHAVGLNEAHLPATVAKGRCPRMWYLFDDALALVQSYIASTRQVSVERARRHRRYERISRLMVTDTRVTTEGVKLKYSGRWWRHDDIEISDRQRLFIDTDAGPEPLWLWLSEAGMPLPVSAWTDVMSDGNDRVLDAFKTASPGGTTSHRARAPRLSPHSLRHSFALYMLIALHHAIDTRDGHTVSTGYHEERYRVAWETVRDLLGHRNETTTRERYLAPLNGVRLRSLIGQADLQRALAGLAKIDPRVLDISGAHHG
jgi:site-specific recombinase XerD